MIGPNVKKVKIFKKGATTDCSIWQGITLLSVPNKILDKITIHWITVLKEEQAGFHREGPAA